MPYLNSNSRLWIVVSALLFAAALVFVQFYLAWICLVPLFGALQDKKRKRAFYDGALFGLVLGVPAFYWMPSVVTHFTGGQVFGIVAYLIAIIFAALYFGLILLAYTVLKRPEPSFWGNALLMAALWTCGEWLLSVCFTGMPWFGFHAGHMLFDNLYAIQVAEYGGVLLMSFFVVLINFLIAHFFFRKQWKRMAIPAGLVLIYMLGGYGIHYRFTQRQAGVATKPFSVAILCENTAPDVKWDEQNGNFLVKRMLGLNAQVAALQPDIALWSESAVPWTYSPDDNFVKEVIKTTSPKGITHILGMNTEYKDNVVYNSAYCLQPDGKMAGRYDKRFLLALVEKPLGFYSLPFLSTDGFYAKAGDKANPLPTFYGKAGVLICNEATVTDAATDLVRNGATFLVNISNDGWFSDIPYLVNLHFYNARVRAVETRKDMAVNSNMGISGKVSASGETDILPTHTGGYVSKVFLNGNNFITLYTTFKLAFIGLVWFCLLGFIIKKIILLKK